jgi:myosin heavy subunit
MDKGSPAAGKGRLEEAAIRRRLEMATSPSVQLSKYAVSVSPSKSAAHGDSRHQLLDSICKGSSGCAVNPMELACKLQFDDDSSVETLCHKFQAFNDALRESNSTQASLQKYLERSLDECERLRAVEAECRRAQSECERLRVAEAESRKDIERLRIVEVEFKKTQIECDELRALEVELDQAKSECDRLRKVEVESRRLKDECDRLTKVEADARKANDECKRLWAVESEARRAQEECERLRSFEVEARQARIECERLRSVETETRRIQEECERLRDVEVEVRKLQSECEGLRAAEIEARKAQDQIDHLRDVEATARKAQSECERLQGVESEARKAEAECKRLQTAEAEAKRARDHHHHRWCVLDQEREGLQRVAQQAREAEKSARAAESRALEDAAAWRRWLASFMDVLLRRGASGFEDAEVSSSQCLAQRQPKVHLLLSQLSQTADPPTPQPELLGQLRALYGDVSSLISSGQLSVRWGGEKDVAETSMD